MSETCSEPVEEAAATVSGELPTTIDQEEQQSASREAAKKGSGQEGNARKSIKPNRRYRGRGVTVFRRA